MRPEIKPWPLWKRAAYLVWSTFELGDREAILWQFGRWPLRFYAVRKDTLANRPSGLRAIPYFRLRTSLATLLKQWCCSCCTLCQKKITLRELLSKRETLSYYMSGSIAHQTCINQRATTATPGHPREDRGRLALKTGHSRERLESALEFLLHQIKNTDPGDPQGVANINVAADAAIRFVGFDLPLCKSCGGAGVVPRPPASIKQAAEGSH